MVGQIARDLVLQISTWPEGGGSAQVTERCEMLGGKGANQAVALRQLGAPAILLGVAGEDDVGSAVLEQARADHLDISAVVRRGQTALLLDLVDQDGTRRLVEHVPEPTLLTAQDVSGAAAAFDRADTVCLQLQQPADALLVGAQMARERGLPVILDGAIEGDARDRLLAMASVVRMDAAEASIMTGIAPDGRDRARRAAQQILEAGPELVAIAVGDEGDLVAWADGEEFVPHASARVVDPTGAGDAFLAGLTVGLRRGESPHRAARRAGDAAAATVQRLGGRPDLRPS